MTSKVAEQVAQVWTDAAVEEIVKAIDMPNGYSVDEEAVRRIVAGYGTQIAALVCNTIVADILPELHDLVDRINSKIEQKGE